MAEGVSLIETIPLVVKLGNRIVEGTNGNMADVLFFDSGFEGLNADLVMMNAC